MAFTMETRADREVALLEAFEAVNAQIAALEADRARLLAERFDLLLEDDPFDSPPHDAAGRSASAAFAAVARLSPGVVDAAMHRAHTLRHRFPLVWEALR